MARRPPGRRDGKERRADTTTTGTLAQRLMADVRSSREELEGGAELSLEGSKKEHDLVGQEKEGSLRRRAFRMGGLQQRFEVAQAGELLSSPTLI